MLIDFNKLVFEDFGTFQIKNKLIDDNLKCLISLIIDDIKHKRYMDVNNIEYDEISVGLNESIYI